MGNLRSGIYRIMLAVTVILLAGCTSLHDYVAQGFKVGPDYAKPAAPVAEDWIDEHDTRISTDEPDLHLWWSVLDDSTLNALITNAVQQNLTLREAGFRVMQARAIRDFAGGNLFPQFQNMDGSYTRNGISKAAANTAFIPTRFFDNWAAGMNLAWEIDFWGRYRRAIESADADLDASVEDYDQVLVTLLSDIASTYTDVRTLQQRIILAEQNVKIQRETAGIADARFRGGLVSELDVDQAQSNLAQTEALIPQLELQLRQATNQLCVLLGEPPSNLVTVLGQGRIPVAPQEVAIGIPAELLRRRPDVRRAERRVAAQSAQVGVATSELYPHISISGTLGYSAQRAGNLFTSRALEGAVGPSFQWNILNYGRLLSQIRLEDARLAELIVAYQNQVLVANAEVENGIALFIRSRERAELLGASVDAAEKAVRVAVAEYRAGTIDFNRVALVEQNLVQQQDLHTSARGDITLGLIAIYRALGGGWEIRLEQLPARVAIPAGIPAPVSKLPIEVAPLPENAEELPANVPDPQQPEAPPGAIQPQPPAAIPPEDPSEDQGAGLKLEGPTLRQATRLTLDADELLSLPRRKE